MTAPLIHGYTPKSIRANVEREVRRGKSGSDAVATSLEEARRAWRHAHPKRPYPTHLRGLRKRPRRSGAGSRNRLEVGRTAFSSAHLKLHLYSGSLRVTELVNAGRRGKAVREFSVIARGHDDAKSSKMLGNLADAFIVNRSTYDEARAYAHAVAAKRNLAVEERSLRGVDVEPMATKVNLRKTFDDGTILSIEASPNDFHVRNSTLAGSARQAYQRGEPGDYSGVRQDTGYWPSGSQSVKRKSAQKFYAWLTAHLAEAASMTIGDVKDVWKRLGVSYDSH
jgi:hypothetical protein